MTNIFNLPTVEEFDHGPWRCFIKRQEAEDWPGAAPLYYPTYQQGKNGKHRGWYHSFADIEECRAFLRQGAEVKAAALTKGREQGRATAKRRKEQRITKVTRDYLLGKHIGNRETCAMCDRALSDPLSIERGIGSECWPNLMDRLAREAPRCETAIASLQAELPVAKALSFEQWLDKKGYRPILERLNEDDMSRLRHSYRVETASHISMLERQLADAEMLLAAARRWNVQLLAA